LAHPAKFFAGAALGILLLSGSALPAAAQISGFKVSMTQTEGLEVKYDMTAYAVAFGGPYVKAGFALDQSFSTLYLTSYDFGFGYAPTNYVVNFTSNEDWNTTGPPVVTFGDGNFKNDFVLAYDVSAALARPDDVQGVSTYRGSFIHSYPTPGTYSIQARLTPDGDTITPGLASTGNVAAYPPTTGTAVVGSLVKSFESLFRVARSVSPSNVLTSVIGSGVATFGPTVRYLVNQSAPFTIDNLPGLDIKTPHDPSNFGSNTTLELNGAAFDPEDGDLSSTISWSSDLDGFLGVGSAVVTTLSPGLHTLTATVADSVANLVMDTATVNVAAGGPTLAVSSGVCPGLVNLTVSGMNPGDKVAIYTGTAPGQTLVPGACAGAIIDLDAADLRHVRFADGAGQVLINRFFPLAQCSLRIQVIDLGFGGSVCQTSNVLPTPVPAANAGGIVRAVPTESNHGKE
jgi:hypothetical protein